MKVPALTLLLLLSVSASGQDKSFAATLEEARRGERDAQNEVGIMYSEGKGVRANQKKAVYWFQKSADQAYAIGACNLGLHYARGWGVKKNRTLMMKWTFIGAARDGLKCHPGDYIEAFRPKDCEIEKGGELAVAWLRARPGVKDSFGERPWMKDGGAYPITVREHGSSTMLPPNKSKRKCI